MTEFETQNTVDVVVDDRSLTEARADVEDALSSVPLDVQAEVSGRGGGSEVAARDRARQRQLLTAQTDSIEGLREEFEENDVGEEWQEQHSLSRERNRLLQQLVESTEDGNFDRASRSGGVLGMIMGGGALLGVGALSGVLSNFSWPSLPKFDAPDWLPPDVPEPGWTPIGVKDPGEATIEKPAEAPVADPKEAPVEKPSEAPIEDPEKAEVAEPDWKVQVEEPGFEVPVEDTEPAGESSGVVDAVNSRKGTIAAILGLTGVGAAAAKKLSARGVIQSGTSASGGAFLTPEMVGATDQEQFNERRRSFNKQTPDWLQLPEMEGKNKYPGSVFTAEGRQAQVEGVRELVSALSDFRDDVRSTQEDSSSTRSTEVNVESNVTVDGATRREVERAAEDAKQQALRDFNQQIRER